MSNEGILIVISGPSGVGKTTLCEALIQRGLAQRVVTATTRSPREGEKDGEDYFFLSKESFSEKLKNDEFIENALVYQDYYGILKCEIENGLRAGKNLLLNIDVQGAQSVRKLYPGVLDVFVDVSDLASLKERLRARGQDSEGVIESRLKKVEEERARRDEFSQVIYNDELEDCTEQLINLINDFGKEHHV